MFSYFIINTNRCMAIFSVGKGLASIAQKDTLSIANIWSKAAAGDDGGACFTTFTVKPVSRFTGGIHFVPHGDYSLTRPSGSSHPVSDWMGYRCVEDGIRFIYLYPKGSEGFTEHAKRIDEAQGVKPGSAHAAGYICGRFRDIKDRIILSLKEKMYQDDLDLLSDHK